MVSITIFEKRKGYVNNFQVDPYASIGFAQPENAVIRTLKHPNFISNIYNDEQRKQIITKAIVEVSLILQKENCLDFDKLK